eukprot:s880_g33.t1
MAEHKFIADSRVFCGSHKLYMAWKLEPVSGSVPSAKCQDKDASRGPNTHGALRSEVTVSRSKLGEAAASKARGGTFVFNLGCLSPVSMQA